MQERATGQSQTERARREGEPTAKRDGITERSSRAAQGENLAKFAGKRSQSRPDFVHCKVVKRNNLNSKKNKDFVEKYISLNVYFNFEVNYFKKKKAISFGEHNYRPP
jgi:hypothetical protein